MQKILSPAKINLSLRIGKIDNEGMHPLESFIGFADFGDRISLIKLSKSKCLTNVIMKFSGPFAHKMPQSKQNFLYRAALIFKEIIGQDFELEVELEKNLPLASGLGGGTVNGGTLLRLLVSYWKTNWPEEIKGHILDSLALAKDFGSLLGADGAMAIAQQGLWAESYGERLTPVAFEPMAIALFHHGIDCPTGPIFKRFDQCSPNGEPLTGLPFNLQSQPYLTRPLWLEWVKSSTNDLEIPAIDMFPEIGIGIKQLSVMGGCHLARMSGSGAAFYGLFDALSQAEEARDKMLETGHYPTSFVGMVSS
jgi:4-diphosphocytidyl-2-C-methyl-D-erythritol kinase